MGIIDSVPGARKLTNIEANQENQVISFEIAKKLKKLGVKQNSVFYVKDRGNSCEAEEYYFPKYALFTASELLKMLPHEIDGYQINIKKYAYGYQVLYEKYIQYDGVNVLCSIVESKLEDCLGNMIAHLIGIKLIEIEL